MRYAKVSNIFLFLHDRVEHEVRLEDPGDPRVLEHLGVHARLEPPLNHPAPLADIDPPLISSPIRSDGGGEHGVGAPEALVALPVDGLGRELTTMPPAHCPGSVAFVVHVGER